jgi:hypothetical protein
MHMMLGQARAQLRKATRSRLILGRSQAIIRKHLEDEENIRGMSK